MTNEQLAALDAAATQGYWMAPPYTSVLGRGIVASPSGRMIGTVNQQENEPANADFIAALVNAYRAGQLVVRTEPSEADVERVARIIDPGSWAVMDSELKRMLHKYRGQHIGWPADQFQHKESMALARAAIAAMARHD